jgi:hypothetical protein
MHSPQIGLIVGREDSKGCYTQADPLDLGVSRPQHHPCDTMVPTVLQSIETGDQSTDDTSLLRLPGCVELVRDAQRTI